MCNITSNFVIFIVRLVYEYIGVYKYIHVHNIMCVPVDWKVCLFDEEA